jgi:hypothetical protein
VQRKQGKWPNALANVEKAAALEPFWNNPRFQRLLAKYEPRE